MSELFRGEVWGVPVEKAKPRDIRHMNRLIRWILSPKYLQENQAYDELISKGETHGPGTES